MRIDRVKLAASLVRADLNGKQLSEKAGMSRTTVSPVRRGKACSAETALKLARAHGVDLEELLEVEKA